MKKLLLPILLVAALAAGCSKAEAPAPASSESVSESVVAESSSEAPASSEAASEAVVYENADLGIKFNLPVAMKDKYEVKAEDAKEGAEAVKVLTFSYKGEESSQVVFTVKAMSPKAFEASKDKAKFTQIGANETTVVVMAAAEKNAYKEATPDFDAFAAITADTKTIAESFVFSK